MIGIIKYSIKSMMRKKTRAFLTVIGITIGVMSVIVISAIGETGKSVINNELDSIGVSGLTVSAKQNNVAYNLNTNDLEAVKNEENVQSATPLSAFPAKSKFCEIERDCMAWGISDNVQSIVSVKLLHGRMITKGDVESGSKVCVVDEAFAKANYMRNNIVGKTVRLMLKGSYDDYYVVGVVSTGGNILKNFIGDLIASFVYLPYTTIEKQLGVSGFSRIAVKINKDADSAKISNDIKSKLKNIYPSNTDVKVEDLTSQKDKLNQIMNIITIILSVIAGISLVVSGLSIMTVMLVSVNERTREIGIKKSIGASKLTILFEFLSESFIISLAGGAAGSIIGIILINIGCAFTGISAIININTIFSSIGFAIFVGILFGVYPAVKAANLKPAQAIRYE